MTHEELVERVAHAVCRQQRERSGRRYIPDLFFPTEDELDEARASIAAVREALKEPTPRMREAYYRVFAFARPTILADETAAWRSMLSASPLESK